MNFLAGVGSVTSNKPVVICNAEQMHKFLKEFLPLGTEATV